MTASAQARAKVLFVLPSFAGGGAERVALLLLAGIDRGAFLPHLAVLEASGPLNALVPPDAVLHDLARPRVSDALPALVALIRRQRPAVVFATQGYLNVALLAVRPLLPAGTRIAIRESNTPSQSLPNRRHPRFMAWAYRCCYPRADLVFCQHRQTETELRDDFGVPAARIVSLPNPVPVEELRAAAAPPLRHPGAGLRFVSAGRLTRQKGFDRLIALFDRLPADAHLTIYGEGGEREEPEQDPGGHAGADACIIASRWEGLPNVALEALAVGTPVIATSESGGIAELAAAAPRGAVTVAPWGDAFAAAMATCPLRASGALAPSLLPSRYGLGGVAAGFNAALATLARPADLG